MGKEEETAEAIEAWEERMNRLSRYGDEYKLPETGKKVALKKILIARWQATFVAAEPICGSEKLFRARPPQSRVASRFLIPAILI